MWYCVYIHTGSVRGIGWVPTQLTYTQIAAYATCLFWRVPKTYLIRCNLSWNEKDEEDCSCMYDDDCGLERSFGVRI